MDANDRGGIFTCEKQVIGELKKRNVIVDVVILGDGVNLKEYEKMCGKAYHLPLLRANYSGSVIRIARSIIKTYRYGLKHSGHLKKQIGNDVKYDAVMYQRPIFIHLAGMLAALLQTKCLWHLPNAVRTSFSRNYYNYFCRKYSITQLANSFYTKSTLGAQCKHVIYPGYDSARIGSSAPALRHGLQLGEDAPVYGIAARMHKDKAQDLVVEAFVNSKVPGAGGHLLIAGGPLDSEFARKVQQQAGHLLHKQVHFLGEIKDMPAFYASVDVVINGRRNVEPFGISIAEAMGAGKPVIAYKLGGPAEMVKHTFTGWLVENPAAEEFKEMFDLSIANKSRWRDMGKRAVANSSEFSIETNVDKLLKIVNKELSASLPESAVQSAS